MHKDPFLPHTTVALINLSKSSLFSQKPHFMHIAFGCDMLEDNNNVHHGSPPKGDEHEALSA
jgi:hypothetical protein